MKVKNITVAMKTNIIVMLSDAYVAGKLPKGAMKKIADECGVNGLRLLQHTLCCAQRKY